MSIARKQEFDRFAANYEHVLDEAVRFSGEQGAYFADVKARYIRDFVGARFSGSVLDYGCGIGLLAGLLKEYLPAARLDGFDVSYDSIRRVSRALAAQGQFTSDAVQLADGYQLIVVANVMHHIAPERRPEVVQDLADRLSPGGMLAIFEHNPANPITRRVVERCPFDEDAILLPAAETAAYVSRAKLCQLRLDYIVFMPRFLAWLRPLERRLAWLPMGAQYAIVAEKHA
jgi:SAM-dependent methyltransferase